MSNHATRRANRTNPPGWLEYEPWVRMAYETASADIDGAMPFKSGPRHAHRVKWRELCADRGNEWYETITIEEIYLLPVFSWKDDGTPWGYSMALQNIANALLLSRSHPGPWSMQGAVNAARARS